MRDDMAQSPMVLAGPDGMVDMSNPTMIAGTAQQADAVSRLRDMIAERETETVQILQDWMEEPQKTEQT